MRPDKTPTRLLYVARGAPDELELAEKDIATGAYTAFNGPVSMRITLDAGTVINLTEGAGITMATEETTGVPRGIIKALLTVAQSRQIPVGNFASYEIQEAAVAGERIVMMGRLVGTGGNNVDG